MQPRPANTSKPRIDRGDAACIALLAALVIMLCLPTFNGKLSYNDDWRRLCALAGAARKTVLVEHAFPFRSPYFGGGYPTIAEPEDPTCSPFFLLALACGEVAGLKLRALLCVLAAALGMFHFARRRLAFSRWGALAAAALLVSASWFHARHLGGNVTEMQYAFAPVLMSLLLAPRVSRLRFAAAALLLAVVAIDGKLVWASLVLYLVLTSAAWALAKRERVLGAAGRVLLAAAVSLPLAGVKLVPMLHLMHERGSAAQPDVYPHKPGYSPKSIGAYSMRGLAKSLVDASYRPGDIRARRLTVGWAALAMAVGGLVVGWRRLWWLIAPGAVCGWLMFSHHATPDLFWLLHHAPPFNVMAFPNKYFDFFVLLTLCALCGQLVTSAPRRLGKRAGGCVALALTAALIAGPLRSSCEITSHIFSEPCALARTPGSFFHVRSGFEIRSRARLPQSDTYLNFLANVGTIDWFTPLPLESAVQPRYYVQPDGADRPNPSYRGEAYALAEPDTVTIVDRGATRIVLDAHLVAGNQIVVNENASDAWRASNGAAVAHEGLLSARLSDRGDCRVTLWYFPLDFALGLALSLASLAGLGVYAARRTKPEALSD